MSKELSFAKVGNFGLEAAIDGDNLILRMPNNRNAAKPVPAGKTYAMTASSGGWTSIPGTDVRVSLNAGFKG